MWIDLQHNTAKHAFLSRLGCSNWQVLWSASRGAQTGSPLTSFFPMISFSSFVFAVWPSSSALKMNLLHLFQWTDVVDGDNEISVFLLCTKAPGLCVVHSAPVSPWCALLLLHSQALKADPRTTYWSSVVLQSISCRSIEKKTLNTTSIWLRMQNIVSMTHVYKSCSYLCGQKPEKELPLSRNPHFGWSQTPRCLLLPQIGLSSVSATQSEGQSSTPPRQTFLISGWQRWCVRGLLCRRGCRIIAELCRFSLSAAAPCRQAGAARHENTSCLQQGKVLSHPRERSLWADGDISLSRKLNVVCLFLSLEVASYCSHFSISFLLSASQRYQAFHWSLSGRLL